MALQVGACRNAGSGRGELLERDRDLATVPAPASRLEARGFKTLPPASEQRPDRDVAGPPRVLPRPLVRPVGRWRPRAARRYISLLVHPCSHSVEHLLAGPVRLVGAARRTKRTSFGGDDRRSAIPARACAQVV